jgi:ABC-type nitrate/sulfonate/bicarbonate transport system permease component
VSDLASVESQRTQAPLSGVIASEIETAGDSIRPGGGTPPEGTVRSARKGRKTLVRVLIAIWAPIVLLVIWWFVSAGSKSPYFPPLSKIVDALYTQWIIGPAKAQLVPSLTNLGIGYVGGALIGIIAGVLLWRLPAVRRATSPVVYFLYVLPAPALLPALIALFGIGEMRQIALIAFGSVWPTLLNTLDGMRGVDQVKFDTAKAMRLSPTRTVWSVVLRGASPQIAAGLRASLQVAIILMVISEMVAAKGGIGYYILQSQANLALVNMWSGILVLAIVGTILNYLFVAVERGALSWYHGSRALGTDKS